MTAIEAHQYLAPHSYLWLDYPKAEALTALATARRLSNDDREIDAYNALIAFVESHEQLAYTHPRLSYYLHLCPDCERLAALSNWQAGYWCTCSACGTETSCHEWEYQRTEFVSDILAEIKTLLAEQNESGDNDEKETNLAHTIPITDTIHGVGEEVFPRLRTWLREIGADRLIPLIDAREEYGIAKHGQTLRTGDGRHTPTEIAGEAGDELAYGMKTWMQRPDLAPLIQDAMLFSVQAADAWLDVAELMDAEPWTQDELDRAEVKAKELSVLLDPIAAHTAIRQVKDQP